MSRPRALTEQQAIDAEAWYQEFERVGTFEAKAYQLGVRTKVLRDAIRRVRGQDTYCTRDKLSGLVDLINKVSRETDQLGSIELTIEPESEVA